ncbi:hypothetical protein Fmac_032317 [Flemingia macrophylla]|uniref:Uncharacterized protein n=1 Tax=Flemingia macrophylla TaxID=520843 RepID=A0ABD1L4K2_9FABA
MTLGKGGRINGDRGERQIVLGYCPRCVTVKGKIKNEGSEKLRLSGKKKVEKDHGIPNDWPLKEHEVKALEAGKAKAIEELGQKKVENKVWKRKLELLEDEDNFNGANWILSKIVVNLFDLVKVIEVSDVLLDVIDARDPLVGDIRPVVVKAFDAYKPLSEITAQGDYRNLESESPDGTDLNLIMEESSDIRRQLKKMDILRYRVERIEHICASMPHEARIDFEKSYDRVLDLLKIYVDPAFMRLLVHFWNPNLYCFEFPHFDLVPTLEEYELMLRWPKSVGVYTFRGDHIVVDKMAKLVKLPPHQATLVGNGSIKGWKLKMLEDHLFSLADKGD